jgi:hypothetical protein
MDRWFRQRNDGERSQVSKFEEVPNHDAQEQRRCRAMEFGKAFPCPFAIRSEVAVKNVLSRKPDGGLERGEFDVETERNRR